MGRLFLVSLEGRIYSCRHCYAHLGVAKEILSKAFHSRNGKAYLIENVVNVTLGEIEDRMMLTGMHSVQDTFCVGCGSCVGWKYVAAHDKPQKYKEGKFVLERYQLNGPIGIEYPLIQDTELVSETEYPDNPDDA